MAPGWNLVLGYQLHLLSAVPTKNSLAAAEAGDTTGLRLVRRKHQRLVG